MVTTRATPKAEPFVLENIDTTLIPSANRSDTTANAWGAIWQFQVPAGQMMVLGPDDEFKAYLQDTGAAEVGNNTCRVRLAISDTSEQDKRVIFGPVQYVQVKEFQDRRKVMRLRLPEPVQVYEEQFILIEAYDDTGVDEPTSAFNLTMTRVRQGLS